MGPRDTHFVFVVYDPPPGTSFPYLAAAFVPGKAEPMVTPFKTAHEAEQFNVRIGKTAASQINKGA